MNDKRANSLPYVLVALLLFVPILYVGSYLYLLEPAELDLSSNFYRPRVIRVEHYAVDPAWHTLLHGIFMPIHWLDRTLRPDFWQPPVP